MKTKAKEIKKIVKEGYAKVAAQNVSISIGPMLIRTTPVDCMD